VRHNKVCDHKIETLCGNFLKRLSAIRCFTDYIAFAAEELTKMVEVLGVVVVTLFVGLIVWLMRFLAGSLAKDA
jgi:hypothetical protein